MNKLIRNLRCLINLKLPVLNTYKVAILLFIPSVLNSLWYFSEERRRKLDDGFYTLDDRVLSTIDVLGYIQGTETISTTDKFGITTYTKGQNYEIAVLSAMPVTKLGKKSVKKIGLILHAPQPKFDESKVNVADGSLVDTPHYIQYETGERFHLTQYGKLEEAQYDSDIRTWYADMPDSLFDRWTARGEDGGKNNCLSFSIYDKNLDEIVSDGLLSSCYNPIALPVKPHKLVLCLDQRTTSDDKHENTYSGWISLIPHILYHIEHGVDQIVLFLEQSQDREYMFELFDPFISTGYMTIMMLNNDPIPGDWAPYVGRFSNNYREVQGWFQNECIMRFKGHAELMTFNDPDEFLYNTSWTKESFVDNNIIEKSTDLYHRSASRKYVDILGFHKEGSFASFLIDEIFKFINLFQWPKYITKIILDYNDLTFLRKNTTKNQPSLLTLLYGFQKDKDSDFYYTQSHDWVKPEHSEFTMLHTHIREEGKALRFHKSIVKPEKIAQGWVHLPNNCFGKCKEPKYDENNKIMYAHIKIVAENYLKGKNEKKDNFEEKIFVTDNLFQNEALRIDKIICELYPSSCSPHPLAWVPHRKDFLKEKLFIDLTTGNED